MKKPAVALLIGLSFHCLGFSQIYKWKDKDGNLVVSTTPPPPGVAAERRELEKVQPAAKPTPRAAGGQADVQSEFKRPYKDIKVVMYVTEWCTYCRKARAFLQSLGVNLVEYDVEKDPVRQKEWRTKSGGRGGVPLIEIEGRIEHGFNPTRLRAAIEEKRVF